MAEHEELPVMNPALSYTEGYFITRGVSNPYMSAKEGFAATDFIYTGTSGSFFFYQPQTSKATGGSSYGLGHILQYKVIDGDYTDWWNNRLNGGTRSIALSSSKCYIRFGFDPDCMADMYGYNTSSGEVFFAGINTPYYGKTNIND